MIQVYKLNSCVYLVCTATSFAFSRLYAASGKDLGCHNWCINFTPLSLTLFVTLGAYTLTAFTSCKNASNSTTPSSRQCTSQTSQPTAFDVTVTWVATGYYGLSCNKLVITQQCMHYTALHDGPMADLHYIADCLLYLPHIAWASCHHYETGSTLRTNRVHHFRSVT